MTDMTFEARVKAAGLAPKPEDMAKLEALVKDMDRAAAWLIAAFYACGPESGVGQDGEYTFVSTAPVVDSTPYPLHDLVQVEQDDDRGVALVYLFSGELGQAGLGLPDLRRVARQFGRFQMAFDTPRSNFTRGVLARSMPRSPHTVYH